MRWALSYFVCPRVRAMSQLHKKADKVELSQSTPSFSKGLDSSPRKVSSPPDWCPIFDTASPMLKLSTTGTTMDRNILNHAVSLSKTSKFAGEEETRTLFLLRKIVERSHILTPIVLPVCMPWSPTNLQAPHAALVSSVDLTPILLRPSAFVCANLWLGDWFFRKKLGLHGV